MKTTLRLAASLVLLGGIAGCEPLGDGSTVETLRLANFISDFEHGVVVPATDTTPEYFKIYDCFCSNLSAIATFTDGTPSNFSFRVKYSSSNPDVVAVVNRDEPDTGRCPFAQFGPGALIPNGIGTATITARFGELVDTLQVRVTATPDAFTLAPTDLDAANAVVVGSFLPMSLTTTLDGRTRSVNRNVRSWTLSPEDTAVASISTLGTVSGFAVDPAGTPRTVRAAFGDNCPITVETQVSVGDILGPLSIAREPGFVADGDTLLAKDSDEFVRVVASLDFNADRVEDATQVIDDFVTLDFSGACTLRVYDASVPDTNCAETAGTCTNETPICPSTTATACPTSLTTACRTTISSLVALGSNRVVATDDGDSPVEFTAVYPRLRGNPTSLSEAIDASATTLQVVALSRYPLDPPWYAVIDRNGAREDVKVTAINGTTLTVVRGVSGGTAESVAGPHDAGASFEQREYASDAPLALQAHGSTLTQVDIVDPVDPLLPLGRLQVHAQGTFVDSDSNSRQQRVTRLTTFNTGSPTLVWDTDDISIASISSTGFMVQRDACGGNVTVRARASTSTDTVDDAFDPDSTDDDTACEADPLCDQVTLCVTRSDPLPEGTVCEEPEVDCTP